MSWPAIVGPVGGSWVAGSRVGAPAAGGRPAPVAAGEPTGTVWCGAWIARRPTGRRAPSGRERPVRQAAVGGSGAPEAQGMTQGRPRVKLADTPAEWAGAVAVRLAVFVDEQHFPLTTEMDEHDRSAVHAIAILAV